MLLLLIFNFFPSIFVVVNDLILKCGNKLSIQVQCIIQYTTKEQNMGELISLINRAKLIQIFL